MKKLLTTGLVGVQVAALVMMATAVAADAPAKGPAAVPGTPYHAWAAEETPDMTGAVDLLDSSLTATNTTPGVDYGFDEDGGFHMKHTGFSTTFLEGYSPVNLEETPYLYWSFEQAEGSGSRASFRLGLEGAYAVSRFSGETESGKLLTTDNIDGSRKNFIAGNETGCVNLYEWYDENNIAGTSQNAMTNIALSRITLYTGTDGSGVDVKFNYLFLGPDPSKATTTEEPTTTTEAPETTTEAPTTTTESTASTTEAAKPQVTSLLSLNKGDWNEMPDENNNLPGSISVDVRDGALVFANSNGKWPCMEYTYETPMTLYNDGNIYYDLTVGDTTNIVLFFNGATPNDFENQGQKVSLSKYIDNTKLNGDDLEAKGESYEGTIAISELGLPEGTNYLTGVKVFAVGEAGKEVVIRNLSADILGDTPPVTTTEAETTGTETTTAADTTASGDATTTGNGVTTTAAPAATTAKKDAPKTGDSGVAAIGAVLLLASTGALLLTLKKNKAR